MRLLIFGASGQTGRELVRQALERRHTVTAFVRQPFKLPLSHPNLRVIQGDVGDTPAVTAALPNHDAVVSALGVGTPLKHDPIVVAGIQHIVHAIEAQGPRRLVYLCGPSQLPSTGR